MKNISLGNNSELNIWSQHNKNLLIRPDANLSRKFDLKSIANLSHDKKYCIIEIKLARGPMMPYGILGAVFTPEEENYLQITVNESRNCIRKFKSDIFVYDVNVCLPNEYTPYILEEITSIVSSDNLPIRGKLNFTYGAINEVYSSVDIFRKLTRLIIYAICKDDITHLDASEIFPILAKSNVKPNSNSGAL